MQLFSRVLIIETSGKIGQVTAAAEGRILSQRLLPEARRHARDLAARSGELLKEQGWQARDLTAVIVCTGPGSFTGLRVGIASAKALAYATDSDLFGVPAFDAVAVKVPNSSARLKSSPTHCKDRSIASASSGRMKDGNRQDLCRSVRSPNG